MEKLSWKKVKSGSNFRRKVKRNMNLILHSVPTVSNLHQPAPPSNNTDDHEIINKPVIFKNCDIADTTVKKSNRCSVVKSDEGCPFLPNPLNSSTDENDFTEETRNNWLLELGEEDDQEKPTSMQTLESEHTKNQLTRDSIKVWANEYNIRHRALKALFKIWNTRIPHIVPQDPRTLLETPTSITIQKLSDGGQYWHQGFEFCLKRCASLIGNLPAISININIDGLPIYKSSKDEFWPILFNIQEIECIQPMIIGIYNGKRKPSTISEFITPFVHEAKNILENGVCFDNGHRVEVKIRCFICDSPARAFVKGVANFNSQHGCLKCTTVGEYSYISHCNIFPRSVCPKRNNEGFRARIYGSHHKCYSDLEELPIDMIDDFPVADELHLLHLGIMKRCLIGWRDGTFRSFRMKWSASDILKISQFLQACKMPSEIHRAVRGLDCLCHWKGLEYRTFLHYIGVVVLKSYLPYDAYAHFLLLFCAVTICSSTLYSVYLEVAREMLEHYVEKYREIYGEEYMTSNVHNLIHLVDDVQKFGILPTFSSYPFENKLYLIKNMLRHSRNPLSQAAKRLSEQSKVDNLNITRKNVFPTLRKQNTGEGISLEGSEQTNVKFFHKVETDNYVLSTYAKDRWFLTKEDEIVCMKNAVVQDGVINIYGSSLRMKTDFFETPIRSSYLNIFSSNCQENAARMYGLNEVKCKLVAVVQDEESVVFIPLLHTL